MAIPRGQAWADVIDEADDEPDALVPADSSNHKRVAENIVSPKNCDANVDCVKACHDFVPGYQQATAASSHDTESLAQSSASQSYLPLTYIGRKESDAIEADSTADPSPQTRDVLLEASPIGKTLRQKLTAGPSGGIAFMTLLSPKELADLNKVQSSGFQQQVQELFALLPRQKMNPNFGFHALAVVVPPKKELEEELGIVAMRASDGSAGSLEIEAIIGLKMDPNEDMQKLLRHTLEQFFMQLGFRRPFFNKRQDIRRNHFSLKGVKETTPMKVQIKCFTKQSDSEPLELPMKPVDLDEAWDVALDHIFRAKQSLKLVGKDRHFVALASHLCESKKVG